MLWASWLRRPKHSQLCWFLLSPRTWRRGKEEGPPLLCLCWAVSLLRSPSTFLLLFSGLSSSSLLPPGCLADFLLYFSSLFSPLLCHYAQLLPICQSTFLFLIFSTVFSAQRVNGEERRSPLLCASLGTRWFLYIFLIMRARLVVLRWGNGIPASAALQNLVKDPNRSCLTLCPTAPARERVEATELGWDVTGVVEVLRSRPQMLGCTVLSSLISPSEHTASSHTSTVKCGCFNHRRESLILLLQHIAASPAPGTTGSLLLSVLNWFQKH